MSAGSNAEVGSDSHATVMKQKMPLYYLIRCVMLENENAPNSAHTSLCMRQSARFLPLLVSGTRGNTWDPYRTQVNPFGLINLASRGLPWKPI